MVQDYKNQDKKSEEKQMVQYYLTLLEQSVHKVGECISFLESTEANCQSVKDVYSGLTQATQELKRDWE